MTGSEEKRTAIAYTRLFREFGQSHKTLNWGSSQNQQLRFKLLAEIGDLEGKRILDVGCGLGDFAGWLAINHISLAYTGLDITADLIGQARANYPSMEFIHGSIMDQSLLRGRSFDYVFASGIFYTYSLSRQEWMQDAINNMWAICDLGIAFNSLSAWSNTFDANEFYADPIATIEFCSKLTPFLALRHDYHPRDFTVHLYRSN